jgi:hypothetical protein
MFGGYGIGNPQINNTYSPYDVENGNKDHWFLKPGVDFWETEFHEMGHAQLFSNFPGEGEASVNVLAAAIYNRLYGMNIDQALGESFDNRPYLTRDQAAMNWMVTPNFRTEKPMDISNTTKDEVRYQQRGYAKYIEMAALFGWEVIDSFYRKEQLDFIAGTPSDNLNEIDSRILRFSRTAGVDMRPLIHFWGVHPENPTKLKTLIEAEKLKPSKAICERLKHYKSIIPLTNAEFVTHAKAFFGGAVPAGWYNLWMPKYDASHGALAQKAMQNIITLYYPNGCPVGVATEEQEDDKYNISISPNPAHDIIAIKCDGIATNSVQLFDELGRLVLEDKTFAADGATRTLQVDKIPVGLYFVRLIGKDFSKTVTVVKQ